ncbi:hypothetical protein BDZ89DRAFT_1061250 [Hymenopellis radicata]|nr:hypothetical protein BDZ89DRAFT_1061250 [Hymenopellis radicata]
MRLHSEVEWAKKRTLIRSARLTLTSDSGLRSESSGGDGSLPPVVVRGCTDNYTANLEH